MWDGCGYSDSIGSDRGSNRQAYAQWVCSRRMPSLIADGDDG